MPEVTLERFGETWAQGVGEDEVAQGAQRPEQSEHGAELIKSSAQFSRSSPLARPGVLVPAAAKTINPTPVRLPLTDAIPHPRLRPIPPFAFYSILMYNNQVQNNKTDR